MTSRILSTDEVDTLFGVQALIDEAENALADAIEEGEKRKEEILEEARQRMLQDSASHAARVLMDAEAAAERQMRSLEPTLARLVAQTVRQLIGDMDENLATERAVTQALTRLKDHRRARITAAPDVADSVRAAVANAGGHGAEVIEIKVDPALEPGRTVLSSDRGFVELGLAAQIAQANAAWESDGDG